MSRQIEGEASGQGLTSIIITTYYRNSKLIDAISSSINQSYKNIEIIVVDDSGERYAESTIDKMNFENIKYIPHESNLGSQAARTTGIDAASGEYVCFLDDDDIFLKDKIEILVNKIRSQEDVGLVYSGYAYNGEGYLPSDTGGIKGNVLKDSLKFNYSTCVPSTMLFTKEIADKINPLDERYAFDGGSLRLKLSLHCHWDFVDQCLVERRDSRNSKGDQYHNRVLCPKVDIIQDYFDIYIKHDKLIAYNILMDEYFVGYCRIYAKKRIWSEEATKYIILSCYYMLKMKKFKIRSVIGLTVSPFGYFGYKLASIINSVLDIVR